MQKAKGKMQKEQHEQQEQHTPAVRVEYDMQALAEMEPRKCGSIRSEIERLHADACELNFQLKCGNREMDLAKLEALARSASQHASRIGGLNAELKGSFQAAAN